MAKTIMVQGTMSNAGKSLLVAALCRILKQDGYKVAPFKSQNMALNSYITEDGLEMGRAQVMQAEAAKIKPSVYMNPILLKPTNDVGSQIIVNGKVLGNMKAVDYFKYKVKLIPEIKKAFSKLEELYDVIIIEGAGSPAEINLRENDIVNMGLAEMLDAPVILVGDIDRGGVFAQLIGTLILLDSKEQDRIKGLVINKFRGDKDILQPGIEMLEEKSKKKVVGVIPYGNIKLEDEDSLTNKFDNKLQKAIDIVVIKYPRMSNFTDFDVFAKYENVSVRFVDNSREFKNPDLIVLPGTKSTIADMKWLRESGLEAKILKNSKTPIWGICGGYQMLGLEIEDPLGVESGGKINGLGLIQTKTVLSNEKTTRQVQGNFNKVQGIFEKLSNKDFKGYEIHMGRTEFLDSDVFLLQKQDGTQEGVYKKIKNVQENRDVYGTYVHGIFDYEDISDIIIEQLSKEKGLSFEEIQQFDYSDFKEKEYDKLADLVRKNIDMEEIYNIINS
ncbi:cobyric acid synthase [Lachnobacterium bovis]|uniref:cobyric acid synthase n=1 Tax=Lachnobacterium bovis TaxID=140626 RepID=UPI0003B51285|nr:cobyric acid synthase [Lachnobacterium bovis]